MIKVVPIACLRDNYAYVVTCEATGKSAIVDPSEAKPVLEHLRGLPAKSVEAIWSTHHHLDHVGGNDELVRALGPVKVCGHASDQGRIPAQTERLNEGDTFALGALTVGVLHIPGHTTGAVAYVVSNGTDTAVFTGDTLFLAGCGRLFEGTPAMMAASLAKLAALAPETRVYCGHEYTESNLRFAAQAEPHNGAVTRRVAWARGEREAGRPTVPGTIADELATNPFMRLGSVELRATFGIAEGADEGVALGVIRGAKDLFR